MIRAALLASLAVVLATASSACTPQDAPSSWEVRAAWARPTPPGARDGVVYLTLRAPTNDLLVGVDVSADVAQSATMHETMGASGDHAMPGMDMGPAATMAMVPLASLPVGPAAAAVFAPGGRHIMLHGLARPLRRGTTVELTLRFAGREPLPVEAIVTDNPPG